MHRCELFGADILETSVRLGGTVTGEHGVGVEKLNSMCVQFSPAERAQFLAVKHAFDPLELLNPGKVIPDAASLRRIRQDARAPRHAAVCRAAEILMDRMRSGARAIARSQVEDARARRSPLEIRGGGTKAFYGGPLAGDRLESADSRASAATSRPSWS
jgi:hypothetical protein